MNNNIDIIEMRKQFYMIFPIHIFLNSTFGDYPMEDYKSFVIFTELFSSNSHSKAIDLVQMPIILN